MANMSRLTRLERLVYQYIKSSKGNVEQSTIIREFEHDYLTEESARAAIGQVLKKLMLYELIARVPTGSERNLNVWKAV